MILLVEDDEREGTILEQWLRAHHFDVEWVRDGISAIGAARNPEVDLIILDVGLPGIDGLQVCRALKEGPVPPPVVMISGRDVDDEVRALGPQGPDVFLPKPFRVATLKAELDRLLPLRPVHSDVTG